MWAQLLGGNRNDFAVPPNIQGQSFAGVLFDDFLYGRFHCQRGSL